RWTTYCSLLPSQGNADQRPCFERRCHGRSIGIAQFPEQRRILQIPRCQQVKPVSSHACVKARQAERHRRSRQPRYRQRAAIGCRHRVRRHLGVAAVGCKHGSLLKLLCNYTGNMPMIDSTLLARLAIASASRRPVVYVDAIFASVPRGPSTNASSAGVNTFSPSCASACVGTSNVPSKSFSVMVSVVTRTGAILPGPHTNSTVGSCDAGTLVEGAGGPLSPSADEIDPINPPPGGAVGNSSISSAASRVYTPLTSASPAVTTLLSAIVSPASIMIVNENASSGGPVTANGLLAVCPGAFAPPV